MTVRGEKTVGRLRPGTYRVTAAPVSAADSGTGVIYAAKPRRVHVTEKRGARVSLRFRRQVPKPQKKSAVSRGGVTKVAVAGVRVVAAAGAIRKGQSLTVATQPRGAVPRGAVPGSLVRISTSQGQPNKPVRVTLGYDRSQIGAGHSPVILHHNDLAKVWAPEATKISGRGQVTTTVSHFSLFSVADRFAWGIGYVTGNRSDGGPPCDAPPAWMWEHSFPHGLNDPLLACAVDSSSTGVRLALTNNRGALMTLRVTGGTVALNRASWPTAVDQQLNALVAKALNAQGRTSMITLAPGQTTRVWIDRPAAGRHVTLQRSDNTKGALLGIAYQFALKLADVGTYLNGLQCMVNYAVTGSNITLANGMQTFRRCLDLDLSLLTDAKSISKPTAAAVKTLGWAVFAVDMGTRYLDWLSDAGFPGAVSFATRPADSVEEGLHLANGAMGSYQPGQALSYQLRAVGGTPPYTFHKYYPTPGPRMPGWLTLTSSGRLTGTVPTGQPAGTISFYVYVVQADGKHSPYAGPGRLVTLNVANTTGIDPPTGRGGSDWIARNPTTGASVHVKNGHYYRIADGGTFTCLATTRIVWDIATLKALKQPSEGNATCTNTGRTNWTYTPTAQGGNTGVNIILRNPTGNAYLINTAGEIQTIPDGGTYVCLTKTNPVIWNTPNTNITAWTPIGSQPAHCGPSIGGPRAETITAGWGHTCALDTSGNAWCWGHDSAGQVGDGNDDQGDPNCFPEHCRFSPEAVSGNHTFTTISAGHYHTCGLDISGKAWCWGQNGHGEVGDGSSPAQAEWRRFTPTAVVGGHVFATISAGGEHTCAIDTAQRAWCWGYDTSGQLGSGGLWGSRVFAPVAVAGNHRFTAIRAAGPNTCALDDAAHAWCWGDAREGQLGDGMPPETHYDPDCYGDGHLCAWKPVRVSGSASYSLVAAACALDTSGKAWCWGLDTNGRVGGGTPWDINFEPVVVAGARNYTTIASTWANTCALDTSGKAWCWGNDSDGQVGDGDDQQADEHAPVAVAGGHTFTQLTVHNRHSCGLDANGKAWCWGEDGYGRLGDGDTNQASKYAPVAVAGGHTWLQP